MKRLILLALAMGFLLFASGTQAAWCNANYASKYPINSLVLNFDTNISNFIELSGLNINNLTTACGDAADITIYNETTCDESADVNFHNWDTTNTDTDVNVLFKPTVNISAATYNGTYYIYTNNSGCSVPSNRTTWQSSFDTFEDGDLTVSPTWTQSQTAGAATVSVSAGAAKEGSNGLKFVYAQNAYDYRKEETLSVLDNNEVVYSVWIRMTDSARQTRVALKDELANNLADFLISGGSMEASKLGGAEVFATAFNSNTWYKLKIEFSDLTNDVNYRMYNASEQLLESKLGVTPKGRGTPAYVEIAPFGLNGAGETHIDNAGFARPLTSTFTIGAEEIEESTNMDVNVWRVDGYDDVSGAYPTFIFLVDGNLTIDFNVYNIDNNRMTFDMNYSSTTTSGTGTVISKDVNLSSEVCTDQSFDDTASCSWDFDIEGITDGNYFILIQLDNGDLTKDASATQSFRTSTPSLTMHFYDENTLKPIDNLTVTVNDVEYTTFGDGNVSIDLNITADETYSVVVTQDSNYTTRYFEFDVNQFAVIDINLLMLRDVNGIDLAFKFYESDETTVLANTRIYAYRMQGDANVAGIRTTNANGEISFFMAPDQNYFFIAQPSGASEIRYDRVQVTFVIPKDEDTLADVSPFDVKQSGIGLIEYAGQSANVTLYLYPNTVSFYQFDTNGGNSYLTRKTVVNYKGNPSTATIQVYLPHVDNGVETVFYTEDTDLGTVPGVRIDCFKNIEGAGTVLVQSVITDDAGTASMSFIIDDLYSFDVYDADGNFVFDFELRPNFTSYYVNIGTASLVITPTEIEHIYVSGIPNERYVAFDADGYDINVYIDVNNGTISKSWFTIINDDGNVTFNTSCGTGCSYHLTLEDLNDTMDVTVFVLVETESGLKLGKRWTFIPHDASGYNLVVTLQSCEFRQGFSCDCDVNIPCFFLLLISVLFMVATMAAVGKTITTDRNALAIIMIFEMSIFTYFTWIPAGFLILTALVVFASIVLSRRGY